MNDLFKRIIDKEKQETPPQKNVGYDDIQRNDRQTTVGRTMVCAIQVRQRHIQVHLRQNATRVLRQVAGVYEQSEQRTESKEKGRKACHVRRVFRHLDETRKRAELPRRNFAQFPLLTQAPEGARSQTPKENYGGRHPSASAGVSVPGSSRQVLQNACNDLSRGGSIRPCHRQYNGQGIALQDAESAPSDGFAFGESGFAAELYAYV